MFEKKLMEMILKDAAKRVQRHYNLNEVIIKAGDVGNECYVVEHGSVEVYELGDDDFSPTDKGAPMTIVNRYGPGDIFGEMALLNSELRTAYVRASAPNTSLFVISRSTFFSALQPSDNSAFKQRRMVRRMSMSSAIMQ